MLDKEEIFLYNIGKSECGICGVYMADMGTKEASKKWGVNQATVARWCREGKIYPQPTQDKPGSPWHIEINATPLKCGKIIKQKENLK